MAFRGGCSCSHAARYGVPWRLQLQSRRQLGRSARAVLTWCSCCSFRAPAWTRRACTAAARSTRPLGWGNVELVTRLLEAGARPDPRSHYGLTPLALAAQNAHLEVMENLLRRGADVLSQAQDEASILYEASASGDPAVISLLLEYGADANVAENMGHMPIHRTAHRGHLQVLNLLIAVTSKGEVDDSGIHPLHSAAAGGHALLDAGFDPNDMLHPWAQRSHDDGRKSALFFTVLNNDVPSAKLLLEAGAMANQDPIKWLQVSLRVGNYELINLLLRYGANVNYYCKVNTSHFPSALQYALKDEVVLRMLCNYGYDVARCFDCPYVMNSLGH
ncbi:hypothetical protein KUCAC02_030030 [Chaenocephalus aceratus]|uniref:Uncharacterized protein n=1 Tax=Chaenocephalus aceratus TaxID=36190 RepID=A0ACB9XHK3_CHAAC|nr:hypothetical protein KUCAC02_030030 [Chaenocephalus aceratus]